MSDYPDFNISALLKGLYAGEPKALAVDSVGNIIAMLKAEYAGSPINLVTDSEGSLFLNLKAQELSELIARFKYGAPDWIHGEWNIIGSGTLSLFDGVGKGQIYMAYVYCTSPDVTAGDTISITMDGELICDITWEYLKAYALGFEAKLPVSFLHADFTTPHLMAALVPGYTFESSLALDYYYSGAGTVTIGYDIIYALI